VESQIQIEMDCLILNGIVARSKNYERSTERV
jgi:hypothetical protein